MDQTHKTALYESLVAQARALTEGEPDFIANAANIASLLYHSLPDLNWAGFYRLIGETLVLGPFHGQPACIRIAVGKGVCGAAVIRRQTIVVSDVHAFPGHIACDAASRSEIVVPILREGAVIAVLDVDSPNLARFDGDDARGLEAVAALLSRGDS